MTPKEISIREDERQRYQIEVIRVLVLNAGEGHAHFRIAGGLGLGRVYETAFEDYVESGRIWDETRLLRLLNDNLEPGERWRERRIDETPP